MINASRCNEFRWCLSIKHPQIFSFCALNGNNPTLLAIICIAFVLERWFLHGTTNLASMASQWKAAEEIFTGLLSDKNHSQTYKNSIRRMLTVFCDVVVRMLLNIYCVFITIWRSFANQSNHLSLTNVSIKPQCHLNWGKSDFFLCFTFEYGRSLA